MTFKSFGVRVAMTLEECSMLAWLASGSPKVSKENI